VPRDPARNDGARPVAPPAKANPRLAAQTRRILGKHYAAKYRVR
jgi:hypothetical protein